VPGNENSQPGHRGGYGPEHVSVQRQRRDPDSLLSFMTLLVKRYRECPELGRGSFQVLRQPHVSVLAHRFTWDDGSLIAGHNLSAEPQTIPLKLDDCDDTDQLRDGVLPVGSDGSCEVGLEGYGYRWPRTVRPGDRTLN
jgi:hypothetical protein